MKEGRTIIFKVRLTREELQLFQKKAESYGGNTSAMVRDAVRLLDDKGVRGQVKSMNTLISFYKTFQQQLSWLGGNFNQSMHRANELTIAGELSPSYFSNVLLPKTKEAISIIRQLKSELDKVHSQIENKQ
ncbi:hypothetical protein [Prevotella lacticifex]|uniref:Mobilization protein n=1 Tax=Prevotella lacticifex TaxID=2854755 RepID=A0A9R1C7I0_9BACT|nr:hypothetical protein [Prevotella lacticifex]GJG37191.1 hypothetical protein PRLR5003_23480 [Prevotella lacticifex]GJG40309.1 hypothetical protein PRLR5019_22800 [Prevotella lacticifex]GJG44003.1 hypothetical protein PRLR5025_27890 [Prevotella lacticifex]GJG46687.1 hypothetical protein PRLR5027_22820 [Prevotella lacticifex]GJG50693.1 hypothetical protein PRLR5052_31060 [Prevotella lacticifex]